MLSWNDWRESVDFCEFWFAISFSAIDVWMTICMVFVFSALVEYSVVNVLARHDAKRRKEMERKVKHHEMNSLRSIVEQVKLAESYKVLFFLSASKIIVRNIFLRHLGNSVAKGISYNFSWLSLIKIATLFKQQ